MRLLALCLAVPLAAGMPADAELRLKLGSVRLESDYRLNFQRTTTDLRVLSLDYVSPGIRGEVVRLSWTAGVSGVISGDRDLAGAPYRSWDRTAYVQDQVRFTFQPRAQMGLEAAFGRTLTGGLRTEVRYGRAGVLANQKGETATVGLFQGVFAGLQQRTWRASLQGGVFLVPIDAMPPAREIALTVGRIF